MNQHQQQSKRLVAVPNESSLSADLSILSSQMIMMNNGLGRPSHNHVAAVEEGQTATSITTSTPTNNAIPTKQSNVPPKPSSSKNAAKAVASTSSPGSTKRKKKSEFRKAPQAPRRFKSPYILFSISKMAEYKNKKQQQPPTSSSNNNNDNNHVNVTSISRRIADEWKTLSQSEREKWDEVAKQDKLRYDAEKKLYTGPWHIPSKRRRKDPTAPKRPASAFLFFCQNQRRRLKEANPELKNTDISKLLGEAWKKAPQHIKQPHIDREQTERELYKTKINEWRTQKNSELESERQHRIAIANQYVIQHGGNGNGGGGETNVDNLPPSSSTSSSTMHVPQLCTSTATKTTAAAAAPSTRATANTSTTPAAKNGAAPTLIHPAPPPTDMKKPPQKPPPSVNHHHNYPPWELAGISAATAAAAVTFQPNAIISGATTTSRTSPSAAAAAAALPTKATPANCTSPPVPPAPSTTTDMKKFPRKHPPASNHHQIHPQWELGGILAGIPAIATNATTTPHLTVPHIPLPLPPFMQQYYGILPSMLMSSVPINMNATNNIEGRTTQLQPPPPPHVSTTTSFLPQYHLKLPPPLPPPSLLPPPQQQEKLPTTNDPVPAARKAAITSAAGMYEHPPDEVATTTPRSVAAATVPTDNVGSYSQSTGSVPVPAQQPQSVAQSLSANTNSVTKTDDDTITAANAGAADPYIALSVASQTTAATSNPVEELETLLQSQPYRALEMQATPSYAALITNSCSSTNSTQTTARGMVAEDEDNDDDELQHDRELQDLQDSSLSFTVTTHAKQPSQLLANKSSSFAPKPLDYDHSDEPSSGHHWFGLFNEASGSSSFDMPLLEEAAQVLERSSSANGGDGGGGPNNTTG